MFLANVEQSEEALKTAVKAPIRDKGMMWFMTREDELALHQRLIFLRQRTQERFCSGEKGGKTMMRGFTKRPSLQIPCRRTLHTLLTRSWLRQN